MASAKSSQELKRRHPEWEPWLAVVDETLAEARERSWDAAVPAVSGEQETGKVPLLAASALELEQTLTRRLFERLIWTASRSSSPAMASLEALARSNLDVSSVFQASVNYDAHRIKEIASAAAADPEAFHAVATLLPMPFLHACNRRWGAAKSESWLNGFCPVCGAWPAVAELRGIERTRYFRCGRCGAGWQVYCLFCPYCGNTDHDQLASLVPEESSSKWLIDACNRCLGYVKGFTTLQGSPPAEVMLDDLRTIHLDLAAVERGYKRPQRPGYFLDVRVSKNGALHGRV
jgi:FdhE protein